MGININGMNQTSIILIMVKRIYYILSWFPLLNVLYITLTSNLIRLKKTQSFFYERSSINICKRHFSMTRYHSQTEWLLYQRKISHLSTCRIPTVNQYWSQKWDRLSNCSFVQFLHLVCKIMTLLRLFCSVKNQSRKLIYE